MGKLNRQASSSIIFIILYFIYYGCVWYKEKTSPPMPPPPQIPGMPVIETPNLHLYDYILTTLRPKSGFTWTFDYFKESILFLLFLILIVNIQNYILFNFSIKDISRSFDFGQLGITIWIAVLTNCLMSLDILAKALKPKFDINKLTNPALTMGVIMVMFAITYILIWLCRSVFNFVA
jgi:hypothetical protein